MKPTHTPLTYQDTHYDSTARPFKERIFHAVLFELIALLIITPLFSYIMGRSITSIGYITLIIATAAVLWNFIYNAAFDYLTRPYIKERTLFVRLLHALLFESGLIIFTVPIIAWILSTSWLEAFILDIGIILFFLPYTVVFNWVYDISREAMCNKSPH